MSSARQKRKAVFDPSALDDDLDEMWPARTAAAPDPTPPLTAPPAPTPPRTEQSQPDQDTAPPSHPAGDDPVKRPHHAPSAPRNAGIKDDHRRHLTTVAAATTATGKRARPPEVLLSSEVYDELYRIQIAEKKVRRSLARPMGAIVMDAIEAHASTLATTWSTATATIGEGQLFERPSSNAVPRRRRHATAPRTVVLSGVTAGNGQRLDNLVQAWGAGTRSALVEQALRYEFGLLGG